MKKYISPEIIELNISETAHGYFKKYWDGGYIGDGLLSGHSTNDPTQTPGYQTPAPTDPAEEHS